MAIICYPHQGIICTQIIKRKRKVRILVLKKYQSRRKLRKVDKIRGLDFFLLHKCANFPLSDVKSPSPPPLEAAWTVSLYLSVIPYFWLIMWINMIFLRIKHVCLIILQKYYEAVTVTYMNTYLGLVCKTWQLHA